MKIRAFEKIDEAAAKVKAYRAKFPAVKKDLYHLSIPASGLARY
jgi:hypothetical protein